jgi:hypothetical protein
MIGGRGHDGVRDFYTNHFVSQIPPDTEIVPISRTTGQGRVVDELLMRFTHSIRLDWLLPGIPPTGRRVELPFVVIVQFDGDKIAHEHLYWDQASVLVQVGLTRSKAPRVRRRNRGASVEPHATDERADSSRGEQERLIPREGPAGHPRWPIPLHAERTGTQEGRVILVAHGFRQAPG